MNGDDERLRNALRNTAQQSPTRSGFLLHVRKDRLGDYVEAHQHVWPEMRGALRRSGWRNYSLFLDPDSGLVAGYFEADDVEAAQREMAKTGVNARWQRAMAEYFVQPDGGTNQELQQYFYLA